VNSNKKLLLPKWVNTAECVWDGPACLQKTPRLKDYYPEYEVLFSEKLGVGGTTLKTVVAETKQIQSTDSLAYIRDIFKQLSHMAYDLPEWKLSEAGVFDLQLFQIFPVWTGVNGPEFDCLKTAGSITEGNSWYIADLQHLRDSFEGIVPLLAFETQSLEDLKVLIKHTGCDKRKLSDFVKREARINGWEKLNEEYTRSLGDKWKYIAR
jgi:hypothetical protein